MDRKREIRQLLTMTPDDVEERAGERLIVCSDIDALHIRMAEDIAQVLETGNRVGRSTQLILPVGPTGQYSALADMINQRQISLADSWFFFMDEYCNDDGNAVSMDHPLSFRRVAEVLFLSQLPRDAGLDRDRVIFPNEDNIAYLPTMIQEIGGIDVCFGGIGIHGHVAFNEPEPGVRETTARRVTLNDFTVTINAVRSRVGGALETFPRQAHTLGMKEILSARQIRLYCRNGCEFDWANTVLRLALFGTPGDDYPVTHIRDCDHVIVTDQDTLASPQHII